MCSLGDFVFTINDVSALSEKFDAPFENAQRIANFDLHISRGIWTQSYEFEATFILQNAASINALKTMVTNKNPVTLAFPDGKAYRVVITSADITRTLFEAGGAPIKQTIKLTLERDFA
jgi:hypothetical protein